MKTQRVSNVVSSQKLEANGIKFVVFGFVFSLIAFTLLSTSWAGDRFMVQGSSVFSAFETVDGASALTYLSPPMSNYPPSRRSLHYRKGLSLCL